MRTYINLPDDLHKAVEAVAKRNGLTLAAQVKIVLANVPEIKAARNAMEKAK